MYKLQLHKKLKYLSNFNAWSLISTWETFDRAFHSNARSLVLLNLFYAEHPGTNNFVQNRQLYKLRTLNLLRISVLFSVYTGLWFICGLVLNWYQLKCNIIVKYIKNICIVFLIYIKQTGWSSINICFSMLCSCKTRICN